MKVVPAPAIIVSLVVGLCLAGIGYIFYRNDWSLTAPRPRPAGFAVPARHIPALVAFNKPTLTLYHFYSADCPCSRFAAHDVEELAQRYQGKLCIVGVVEDVGLANPKPSWRVMPDTLGALAKSFGVYTTPTAVVVDAAGNVIFSGNYNRARFCDDPASAYADKVIAGYFAGDRRPHIQATTYGCKLPSLAAR